MFKLSKKADYGLIAVKHLAMHRQQHACSANEVAEEYGISTTLMAKVLQKLTRAKILLSVAGTNGGYKLSRDAKRISALEVVRAIDGPVILTHCFTEHGVCDQSENCTVREPLRRVHEAILELLENFTINDLAESPAVRLTQLPIAAANPNPQRIHHGL